MEIAQSGILKNLILWAFFMLCLALFPGKGAMAEESPVLENKPLVVMAEANLPTSYGDQWLCRKSQEVRTLRVEKKEDSCNALYNKFGHDQKILSTKNKDNCTPVVLRVKGNLETAGWKCKDISDSLITIQ